jgi:uncharacterized protein YcbK (DUF882 family)
MTQEKITAAEMLKEGLDDGRYASIEDDINIDINTSHYQGIIGFAKDFARQEVESIEKQRDELLKHLTTMTGWAMNYASLKIKNISMPPEFDEILTAIKNAER